MANSNLSKAKSAKNDEFYTQYADIQKEVNAYLEYNPDVFRGRTILLPCDDPEWSNFTKFFAQNFEEFGLKKLISTSYAPESKKILSWQPTLFETENPNYDADKSKTQGKIFVLDHDTNANGTIDIDDLEWSYLQGDGDFRSAEVKTLRDEADIIITNPPFSLFREFLAWIMEAEKQFVIIGNINAVTYKEVFPLIKDNKLWIGATMTGTGQHWFKIPDWYNNGLIKTIEGVRYATIGGACWFTNLDHGRRHQPIQLMSKEDNLKFSKHKEIKEKGYQKYDNYDAIEVSFTDAIPSDYEGAMGVPISFMDKYCPEQFEILGASESEGVGFSNGLWNKDFNVTQPLVEQERKYKRIFIRKKQN